MKNGVGVEAFVDIGQEVLGADRRLDRVQFDFNVVLLGSWIAPPCTSDSGVRCITDEDLNIQNVWGSFSGRLALAPTGRAGFSGDGTYVVSTESGTRALSSWAIEVRGQ